MQEKLNPILYNYFSQIQICGVKPYRLTREDFGSHDLPLYVCLVSSL